MRITPVCAASLFAMSLAACGSDVGDDPAHLECEGGYLWVGLDWNGEEEIDLPYVCAELGNEDDNPEEFPPGYGEVDVTDDDDVVEPPPAPEVVSRLCRRETAPPPPIPEPTTDPETTLAFKAPAPAPACPPDQYQTRFKKFRGPLLVGGRNFGEHSATRISRWKATWSATENGGRGGYVVNLDDTHDHANHGPSPADPNMRKYSESRTIWTVINERGHFTFDRVKDKWCPCTGHINHQTSGDSCYGFRAPNHVCHSDTIYQEIIFRGAGQVGNPPANVCGQGLYGPGRFAP